MRSPSLLWLVAIATTACGSGGGTNTGGGDDVMLPTPVMIPGGGVGGGSSAGVVNVFVIDDASRQPIAGAQVRVGTFDGTTDATGLVVATGLEDGPQDVIAAAPGYRAERWLGANGVNMTMDLHLATVQPPDSVTLTGTVDLGNLLDGATSSVAIVCSETDDIGDPANGNPAGHCSGVADGTGGDVTCSFAITCRTGQVAVLARIVDLVGASQGGIRYAFHDEMMVSANDVQDVGTLVPVGNTQVSATLLPAPPSLTNVVGVIGVELAHGVFQLRMATIDQTGQTQTFELPAMTDVGAAHYRLTGVAAGTVTSNTGQTALTLLRHALSPPPGWLAPPTSIQITPTAATWVPTLNATLHSVEYIVGSTSILDVTSFDGSATFSSSPLVPIPSGAIAKVTAIAAPGLMLTDFGLDADRDKVTMAGQHVVLVP